MNIPAFESILFLLLNIEFKVEQRPVCLCVRPDGVLGKTIFFNLVCVQTFYRISKNTYASGLRNYSLIFGSIFAPFFAGFVCLFKLAKKVQ